MAGGIVIAYDPSLFEANRRAATSRYGAESAMNAYRQFLSKRRGQRNIEKYDREVKRAAPKLTSEYAQRGLYGQGIRSGIYNRGISEFGQEAVRQRGYLTEDLSEDDRLYDIGQRQLLANLQASLADMETDKARQISQDAQALLQLR